MRSFPTIFLASACWGISDYLEKRVEATGVRLCFIYFDPL